MESIQPFRRPFILYDRINLDEAVEKAGDDDGSEELSPELQAILGVEKKEGSERKPDKSAPKKYRSKDGRDFDKLEDYENYVRDQDEKAQSAFRSAAMLRQANLRDGGTSAKTKTAKDGKLEKIDLTTIDPDDTPALRNALLQNERVHEQELEDLRHQFETAEDAATEKETRKEMRTLAVQEAKKLGLKLPESDIEEFLDKAEKSAGIADSVKALVELLQKAEQSANKQTNENADDGDEEKKKPKEKGPIRVPGGGSGGGGQSKEEIMRRATDKINKMMDDGSWYMADLKTQQELTHLATHGERMKSKILG
jgi:hypothetical protein